MASTVRINLSGVFADAVEKTAIQVSVELGKQVSQAEVVRMALKELWGENLERAPGNIVNKGNIPSLGVNDSVNGAFNGDLTGSTVHRPGQIGIDALKSHRA